MYAFKYERPTALADAQKQRRLVVKFWLVAKP